MITMDNINEATKQEIFDQVAKHLLEQAEPSISDENGCAYRGDNGLKCAVGCLITEDQYEDTYRDFEGKVADSLPGVDGHVGEFLDELQRIHDAIDPLLWRGELVKLARANNLNTDALKGNPDAP